MARGNITTVRLGWWTYEYDPNCSTNGGMAAVASAETEKRKGRAAEAAFDTAGLATACAAATATHRSAVANAKTAASGRPAKDEMRPIRCTNDVPFGCGEPMPSLRHATGMTRRSPPWLTPGPDLSRLFITLHSRQRSLLAAQLPAGFPWHRVPVMNQHNPGSLSLADGHRLRICGEHSFRLQHHGTFRRSGWRCKIA